MENGMDTEDHIATGRPDSLAEGVAWFAGELAGADRSGQNLRAAVIRSAPAAIFDGADLSGADLRHADLVGASFREANLAGARLDGAVLRGADLTGCVWDGASFRNASLEGATVPRSLGFVPVLVEAAEVAGVDLSGLPVPEREDVDLLRALADLAQERDVPGIDDRLCLACLDLISDAEITDPDCAGCGGLGLFPEDRNVLAGRQPMTCVWCNGRGLIEGDWWCSSVWACVGCNGLGRMGHEALDRGFVIRSVSRSRPDLDILYAHPRATVPAVNADLSGIAFRQPDFAGQPFERCRFAPGALAGANLDGVRFVGCDLRGQDFRGASLDCAEFVRCDLAGVRWDDHPRGHVTFEECRRS